ncbi:MAG TPA: hypothetical protein V6C89_01125 [Drouetiella sp.]
MNLKILALAYSVAFTFSVQESGSQPNVSTNPFGTLTQTGSETPEQLVNKMRLINPEFAEICDARYDTALDVQNAAYQLHLSTNSNPLILEFASTETKSAKSSKSNNYGLSPCIKLPANLSAHILQIYGTTFQKIAAELNTAYRTYKNDLQKLSVSLAEAPNKIAECGQAKESRSKLENLVGSVAVEKIDKNSNIEQLLVRNFEENEPELTILVKGAIAKQFPEPAKSRDHSITLSRKNDLILALCDCLFERRRLIVANPAGIVSLTIPDLEPTYPTITPRAPIFVLPAQAKMKDSTGLPLNSLQKRRPEDLRNIDSLFRRELLHSQAEQIRGLYKSYRDSCRQLASALKDQTVRYYNNAPLSKLVNDVKFARRLLVSASDETAVKQIDDLNHFATVVRAAGLDRDDDSFAQFLEPALHTTIEIGSQEYDSFVSPVKESVFPTVTWNRSYTPTYEEVFRNKYAEFSKLCDAAFQHSEEAQRLSKQIGLHHKSNPIILIVGRSNRVNSNGTLVNELAKEHRICDVNVSHEISQSELIHFVVRLSDLADRLCSASSQYANALNELAAINLKGPAESVESQLRITLEKRNTLTTLVGDKAVAELDRNYKNLFADAYRRDHPDFSFLCDAALGHVEPHGLIRSRLEKDSENPFILVNSHTEPFGWKRPETGFACPSSDMLKWTVPESRPLNQIPTYMRPPQFVKTATQTEKILIYLQTRNTSDQLDSAYKQYIDGLAKLSKPYDHSLRSDLIDRLTIMRIQFARKNLTDLCGEDAVNRLDKHEKFIPQMNKLHRMILQSKLGS